MIDVLQTTERPGEAFEVQWRQGIKRRVVAILAAITLWGSVVQARLLWLQVIEHDTYVTAALNQQRKHITVPAPRGDIVDRHGQMLATSAEGTAITADPSDVDDPVATAAQLCAALGDCSPTERADFVAKLSDRKREFAWLRRWRAVSGKQVERVRALQLQGISLTAEPGRYYPNGWLAAHLLGFVGVGDGLNNEGLAGLELVYDDVVGGQPGEFLIERDGKKPMQTRVEVPAVPGATLELTIDRNVQWIAERELETAVKEHDARGGTVIVMNPMTGEILAMASYPTFNPNSPGAFTTDERRNRATQDVYEPGSTFKIVTAGAALQEGVLKATEMIDTNPGSITFKGRKPITEAKGHNYGVLSFMDVIVKSSNVGAIKAGLRVGAVLMSRYVHRFGFGEVLGSDFKGQSAGIVAPESKIDESTLASMSMGYNISVTPLQMVTAASAVANGGTLYAPHVVAAIVRDGKREVVAPKVLRRAIDPETAAIITTFMEGVVERGTAKAAQMDRYQVAGKTGTAQQLVDHRYANVYNSSFVGFVPSRNPVLTILVVIDDPRQGGHYGGEVAAPVFKRIADQALRQMAVPPTIRPVPPIVVAGAPAPVVSSPELPTVIPAMTSVGDRKPMPDVRGLAARDAVRALGRAGLLVRLRGSGFVTAQTPEPGQLVQSGEVSVLDLHRSPQDASKPSGSPGGKGR
ncbi:MAG TPA: penicillin-binding protein [Vicinamibacterales bacterium]|nr:penicillin-binding protein [Vicinamibacterales bacterium]